MKASLAASLGFHAAILIAALVVLPSPRNEAPLVEAIQVDISNISSANKLMAMSKDAEKPAEKPAPKKAEVIKKEDPTLKVANEEKKAAKQAKAPPPPPPEPEVKKEEPKKEEVKKEEPPPPDAKAMADLLKKTVEEPPKKKEEPKKAEKKPDKPKPEKKPEKKAKPLDVAGLEEILNNDALLNKENEEKTTNASDAVTDGSPAQGEKNLQGKDQALSATAIAAFAQRVKECWVIPPGAREGNITVRIRIQLNRDGSVAGNPEVLNGPGDFLFETTARSTAAAILQCQNYDFLPQDQYDLWKDLVLRFNPNMFGNTATQ
jgi:outer membrane biosynthesis protein TonB